MQTEEINLKLEEKLGIILDLLSALTKPVEEQFNRVGITLGELNEETNSISEMVAKAEGLMLGKELTDSTEALEKILERMSTYLKNTDSKSSLIKQTLLETKNQVLSINDALSSFKKIVKTLRILGVSTRIESARLSDQATLADNKLGSNFITLAENVDKLSDLIDMKAIDIRGKGIVLGTAIRDALDKIKGLEIDSQHCGNSILVETQNNIQAMLSNHKASSKIAKAVGADFEKISGKIFGIVESMQYHDITRQELEGITDQVASAKWRILETIEIEPASILRLEKGFIATREKLSGAITEIVLNLQAVSDSASKAAGNLRSITAGVSNTSQKSFVSEIEERLLSVAATFNNHLSVNRDLSKAVKSMSQMTEAMHVFVGDIEDIGAEIELIAINARVKAAHTGLEGAALGELAESIQRLAGETREITSKVAEILISIISQAKQLRSSLEASNLHADQDEAGILIDLKALTETLSAINEDIKQILIPLNQSETRLVTKIQGIINDTIAQQAIEVCGSKVEELLSEVSSAFGSHEENGTFTVPIPVLEINLTSRNDFPAVELF